MAIFSSMKNTKNKEALLVLQNGKIYKGKGFGKTSVRYGELVFNTSMTGYVESITDPSYAGQILTFSYPLIGNYGVSKEWFESEDAQVVGVVVSELSENNFHRQKDFSLDEFLNKSGKGGIAGVDTRELVKLVRNYGTMPAVLIVGGEGEELDFDSFSFEELLEKVENKEEIGFLDWPRKVGTKEVKVFLNSQSSQESPLTPEANTESPLTPLIKGGTGKQVVQNSQTVALLDFGTKMNIVREINKRGFDVAVLPPDTSFEDVMKHKPVGVLISNGPGDPRDYDYSYPTINSLIQKVENGELDIPIFGICLGNQLLGVCSGAEIYKMKFGNRGVNQPVQDLNTQRSFLTSQNHSYTVKPETLKENWSVWFKNLNDETVEGIEHKNGKIFSVQFHPEACGGPKDTGFLFDKFVNLILKNEK
jgi:carbamoyl-phosphate synthase small subunit